MVATNQISIIDIQKNKEKGIHIITLKKDINHKRAREKEKNRELQKQP